MAFQYPFPGATTLGIRCRDGVVLASEKRLTYGYFVVSKNVRKVFQVTPKVGAACAGLVSDMQNLIRDLKFLVNLYVLEERRQPSVNSIAKVMSNLLFGNRYFPYLTEAIVGGFDDRGAHVIVLDAMGSMIEDDYAVVGSGAEIAVGVLEGEYRADLGPKEIYELALKALKASMARDSGSGNGIDVLLINDSGIIKDETVPVS
ncbi:MAG: archaeal proteasome endopeptidase complex subunit beta [Thaumarchaeota archaeon]|nr:archaeal proteasome endopeptidase complex subunit beta [Candidatus Calditenuaceae archaeon]MDW8041234.1 archaeal proteasome endopeptidase complex subunit beta [Nitrososphaerota archaeon]